MCLNGKSIGCASSSSYCLTMCPQASHFTFCAFFVGKLLCFVLFHFAFQLCLIWICSFLQCKTLPPWYMYPAESGPPQLQIQGIDVQLFTEQKQCQYLDSTSSFVTLKHHIITLPPSVVCKLLLCPSSGDSLDQISSSLVNEWRKAATPLQSTQNASI